MSALFWYVMIFAPFASIGLFFLLWFLKDRFFDLKFISQNEKYQWLTLGVVTVAADVALTLIALIALLANLIPINVIIEVLLSWYWFLILICPLFLIMGYLAVTAKREDLVKFFSVVLAIAIALICSMVLILIARVNNNPQLIDTWISNPLRMLDPIVQAGGIFINASFGLDKLGLLTDGNLANDRNFYEEFGRTLGLATPLIFTALVFALCAKAGLFNIGAEGSVYLGGFIGGVIGYLLPDILPIPPLLLVIVHIPLAISCAILFGAIYGFIPGYLKAKYEASEVITTIMINPITALLVFFLVREYFYVSVSEYDLRTETPPVLPSAELPHLLPGPMSTEYLIAIGIAICVFIFLFKTSYGLELRAVGENPTAAEYAGIPVKRRQILAMTLAGAIGGLGGAGLALGYFHYFHPSHPIGLGFDGIAVSVLGANNPLALVLVAIFFGAIKNGGENLSTSMAIPKDIIAAMRGLVILFAAAPMLFTYFFRWWERYHRTAEIEAEDENVAEDEREIAKVHKEDLE
ncbi:MAG: ABC transporter permease [Candidatus Hodarchaeota archaeon]